MHESLKRENWDAVEAIEPQKNHVLVWDTDLKRFGLKITPKNARSWVITYRNRHGRTKLYTIGRFPEIPPGKARKMATKLLLRVDGGEDPAEEKRKAREAACDTVAALCDRYLSDHAEVYKKPSSVDEDRRMVKQNVKPELGRLAVIEVNREHVRKLHTSLKETPYRANRVWALLSKMFNLAEEWGLRPDGSNPCKGVRRFPEKSRTRYLKPDELAALGAAVAKLEAEGTISPAVALAVRLLVLTGCRKSEILTLQWADVDLAGCAIRLPDSKTGARGVFLAPAAVKLLSDAPRIEGNPYVVPGHLRGSHLTDLRPSWGFIVEAAGLEDLRPHDLRHAFASVAAVGGESLLVIGSLLGHVELETTRKYAHLSVDPLKAATVRTAGTIAEALGLPSDEVDEEEGKVVPIRPRRKHA